MKILIAITFLGAVLSQINSAQARNESATLKQKKQVVVQPPKNSATTQKFEKATFAAGCFWGTEEFFRKIPGVVKTRVGYTGGTTNHPKYEDMHSGLTGHAESLELEYDPTQVSFTALMDQFYKMHDPTTLNRQGHDVGSQYRSAIFFHSEKQKGEALAFKAKVEKSKAWKKPIVTEIAEAKTFWPAEDYHQQYLIKNPNGYDNHYLRKITFDP